MKVIPDSAGTSALDTWLRGADRDPAPGQAAAAAVALPASAAAQPRDTAEDLLVLDIWGGEAPGPLQPAHSVSAAGASVQDWAEHIFSPLRAKPG